MLFNRLVKSKKDNLERYIFYRGLGYSVEASELLACVTYGGETLAYRMDGFSPDDRLRQLRGWLKDLIESLSTAVEDAATKMMAVPLQKRQRGGGGAKIIWTSAIEAPSLLCSRER